MLWRGRMIWFVTTSWFHLFFPRIENQIRFKTTKNDHCTLYNDHNWWVTTDQNMIRQIIMIEFREMVIIIDDDLTGWHVMRWEQKFVMRWWCNYVMGYIWMTDHPTIIIQWYHFLVASIIPDCLFLPHEMEIRFLLLPSFCALIISSSEHQGDYRHHHQQTDDYLILDEYRMRICASVTTKTTPKSHPKTKKYLERERERLVFLLLSLSPHYVFMNDDENKKKQNENITQRVIWFCLSSWHPTEDWNKKFMYQRSIPLITLCKKFWQMMIGLKIPDHFSYWIMEFSSCLRFSWYMY